MSDERSFVVFIRPEMDAPRILSTTLGQLPDLKVTRWTWARVLKAMEIKIGPEYFFVPESGLGAELTMLIHEAADSSPKGPVGLNRGDPDIVDIQTEWMRVRVSQEAGCIFLTIESTSGPGVGDDRLLSLLSSLHDAYVVDDAFVIAKMKALGRA